MRNFNEIFKKNITSDNIKSHTHTQTHTQTHTHTHTHTHTLIHTHIHTHPHTHTLKKHDFTFSPEDTLLE